MMAAALIVKDLCKRFVQPAVDRLSLTLPPGELYALLGPNGAGKTTTLRMIVGLLAPDAGTIQVFGIDALADPIGAKRLIAWLPDEPMLYDKLTPLEYLEFVAGLWGVDGPTAAKRAEELLRWLELWEHRDQRCEEFSRGMKQKAALAAALIHDPKLLILDEPLSGLDAAMARQVALVLDLVLAVLFCLMLSQTLSMIVQAFYQRGDLDLLLSSPVSVRRVLFVRCAGIALGSMALYLVIVTPLLAPVVVRGQWPLLAIYPLLLSMGLAATGAGLLLALMSFATLGPRRTRTMGQVLAAFVGAFIVLAVQVPQFLPHHHEILGQWLATASHSGWFAQSSPLTWPLRGVFGAPWPLVAIVGDRARCFSAQSRSLGHDSRRSCPRRPARTSAVAAAGGQLRSTPACAPY